MSYNHSVLGFCQRNEKGMEKEYDRYINYNWFPFFIIGSKSKLWHGLKFSIFIVYFWKFTENIFREFKILHSNKRKIYFFKHYNRTKYKIALDKIWTILDQSSYSQQMSFLL